MQKTRTRVIVSRTTLLRSVGILAAAIPEVLVVGCLIDGACSGPLQSISAYYATPVRGIFVVALLALAVLLFVYRGYERKDDVAADLACAFALGAALFPSSSSSALVRTFHLLSAPALFGVLSYISLFLFTKTDPSQRPTREKELRNMIYVACGSVMLACLAGVAVFYTIFSTSSFSALQPIFWFESLALWAFGLSWFVKGKTVLKDRNPDSGAVLMDVDASPGSRPTP